MRCPSPRLSVAALLTCGALLAGCGKSSQSTAGGGNRGVGAGQTARRATGVAPKNTVRLGGGDPASDAAAVARAVYPGLTLGSRPQAIVLVDERDRPRALAAGSLP